MRISSTFLNQYEDNYVFNMSEPVGLSIHAYRGFACYKLRKPMLVLHVAGRLPNDITEVSAKSAEAGGEGLLLAAQEKPNKRNRN